MPKRMTSTIRWAAMCVVSCMVAKLEATPVRVLLAEDNLAFAETAPFTGGPYHYRRQVNLLTARLAEAGVEAAVQSIPLFEFRLSDLDGANSVILLNTFAIMPETREVLDAFVKRGGQLVGIHEVGRYAGQWERVWPFAAMFGLQPLSIDPYGTAVSHAGDDLFRFAEIESGRPSFAGITNRIDFGPGSDSAWITEPAGARVVASYDRYVVRPSDTATATVVTGRVAALTVHDYGEGSAWFVATLPGFLDTADDLQPAGHTLDLLQGILDEAGDPLAFEPADDREVFTGYNRIGSPVGERVEVVFRLYPASATIEPMHVAYGAQGRTDTISPGTSVLWHSSWFEWNGPEAEAEGVFVAEATLGYPAWEENLRIPVADDVLTGAVLPSQLNFFRHMRCGETCHLQDPVRGGYHDASGDYAVRMWSMPHVLWCISRVVEAFPENTDWRAEWAWAVDWCLAVQKPDGTVYASVRPADESSGVISPIELRPSEDPLPRALEDRFSFEYLATYAAAMARSAQTAASIGETVQARAHRASALSAFATIADLPVTRSADLGNRAWAALEIYRFDPDPDLLRRARTDIEVLLKRQLPAGRVNGGRVYGDFFADESETTFSPQQYKVFHAIGMYLAPILLLQELDEDDPLAGPLRQALAAFRDGYLVGMSSMSPYGQFACGLEPAGEGRFDVVPFSHRGAWVRDHGLNADLMALAVVTEELNRVMPDDRLPAIARRQFDWIAGNNPFGYCMIDGLGRDHPPGVAPDLGTGRFTGGIPNGIIGRGPDHLPYWGHSWDSREYWLPQNAYLSAWIALADNAKP